MNPVRTTIHLGLQKPFQALHLSDSHICRADERETERKLRLAAKRGALFDGGVPGRAEACLMEQLAFADENHLPILHTGDFCDFVSMKNLEYMKETLMSRDCFMAAGNHEYSLYVGEAFEDEAYKMQSFDLVSSFCKNDLRFATREINGVNLVAVDNVYYDFTAWQLEKLKKEVEKGLPIVLLVHTPIYTPELFDHIMNHLHQGYASLVGVPEALMRCYPEDRFIQQRATPDTLKFVDYVENEAQIRAILTGHLHYDFECPLPGGTMQYVTGGGYCGCARLVSFI